VCSNQVHYSLASRDIEHEVLPVARLHGTALMVWSPLAGGYLSGKYTPDGSGNSPTRGRRSSLDFPPVDPARIDPVVHALRDIARTLDATPAQVALAWLLGRPGVATVIVGARSAEQLAANLRAADLRLPPADRERLDEMSRPAVPYPYWMQHLHDRDRV
jgi:aryl-alcohol dehydrogenase-like predicted oxidoreductase